MFLQVAKSVQERVKNWMSYTWQHQNIFDESKFLEYLPMKMRTDIAMRVHYSILGKVKLFKNTDPGKCSLDFVPLLFHLGSCVMFSRLTKRLGCSAQTCDISPWRLHLQKRRSGKRNVHNQDRTGSGKAGVIHTVRMCTILGHFDPPP